MKCITLLYHWLASFSRELDMTYGIRPLIAVTHHGSLMPSGPEGVCILALVTGEHKKPDTVLYQVGWLDMEGYAGLESCLGSFSCFKTTLS